MPARRAPHKTAHGVNCPYGVFNWADCDAAAEHQWGRCKAIVGKHEASACTRWAVSDEGYCEQHYVSKVETEKKAARIAIARAELDSRITAYLNWTASHPSVWDRMRKRKGPHRLTELA